MVPVVEDSPLALCDRRSIASDDWELCDQVHSDRCDEAMYLKATACHRWYWLSKQDSSEMTLFVVWDSSRALKGLQGDNCTRDMLHDR